MYNFGRSYKKYISDHVCVPPIKKHYSCIVISLSLIDAVFSELTQNTGGTGTAGHRVQIGNFSLTNDFHLLCSHCSFSLIRNVSQARDFTAGRKSESSSCFAFLSYLILFDSFYIANNIIIAI